MLATVVNSASISCHNPPLIYPTQSEISGGCLSTSYHGGPGSIPGQSVGFVLDEVALGHTFHGLRRPSLSASFHQSSTLHFIHPSSKLCKFSDSRRLQVTQSENYAVIIAKYEQETTVLGTEACHSGCLILRHGEIPHLVWDLNVITRFTITCS